jgi:hypothetical protein
MHAARLPRPQEKEEEWVKKYFQYTGFNLLLAFMCCMSLFLISPAASGSGIPDVKAYLNGVEHPIFKNFFTIKTFVAKVGGGGIKGSQGQQAPCLPLCWGGAGSGSRGQQGRSSRPAGSAPFAAADTRAAICCCRSCRRCWAAPLPWLPAW